MQYTTGRALPCLQQSWDLAWGHCWGCTALQHKYSNWICINLDDLHAYNSKVRDALSRDVSALNLRDVSCPLKYIVIVIIITSSAASAVLSVATTVAPITTLTINCQY